MNRTSNKIASIRTRDAREDPIQSKKASKRGLRRSDVTRVVVYARSRTSENIERQVGECRAYAAGVLGVDPEAAIVMTDRGGAMGLDGSRRPGIAEMLSRIAKFDRIVVVDVERLSRDQEALLYLSGLLADTACELHTVASGRVNVDALAIRGCMSKTAGRKTALQRSRRRRPRMG